MSDSIQLCVLRSHRGFCSILGSGKERVSCTGLKEDCHYKGDISNIKRKIKHHTTSVSSVAATKIASGRNQTATAIYVGKRGKGKSFAAGGVAEAYAKKVCVLLGDNPWEANPEKYFPIKGLPNVGIITEDEMIRTLRKMKEPESEYCAFILDDVGAFLDARDFMSKKNKITNKIFQTVRTKHVFTEITIPDDAGLDKDPRENSDFFCIMEQSIFDYNLSIGRFFEQNKQYRSGNMWYIYLRYAGNTIIRHSFNSPSPEFIAEYEPKRTEMADKLFESSMNALEGMLSEAKEPKKTPEITNREIAKRAIKATEHPRLKKRKVTDKDLYTSLGIEEREWYRMKELEKTSDGLS